MTTSAPSARASSTLCAAPTTPTTRQPAIFASWISAPPTPPAAEWIRMVSRARTRVRPNSAYHAVRKTVGNAAACSSVSSGGRGKTS